MSKMSLVSFPPVDSPSESRSQAVLEALNSTVAGRALGRLGPVGAWVAAVQGKNAPQPFSKARAVIVAGNHGIASRGVSAWSTDATQTQAAELAAGGGAANAAARLAGASMRLVDDFLSTPTQPIDTTAAMSPAEFARACELGVAVADQEIDAGADLIIPGDLGVGNTTVAAAVFGTLTRTEPAQAVGRGSGISDNVWKVKTAIVRDAMFRVRGFRDDIPRVLAEISGQDFACLVGLIAHSAARRTPLLIDGAYPALAAYVAERLAPGTKRWLIAGQLSPEPAHLTCVQALDLTPVLALDMTVGQAAGAMAALPLINLAAELVADLLGEADSPAD